MKIILVVPEYPPFNIGGGGEVFRQIAENLLGFGHEVTVIYGYYATKSIFEKIENTNLNNIQFIRVPEIPVPTSMPFLKTVLPMLPFERTKLKNIIKEINPDIVNIHGYGLFFPAQVSKMLVKLGIPYVLTLHGAPVSPGKMKGMVGIFYNLYNQFYGKPLLSQAKYITSVSKFTTTFSEFREYMGKIKIINNGINIDELVKVAKEEQISIFDEYGNGELIFFSLGRLEWLKGFQHFIKIIPFLKRNFKIKYFIGGTDNNFKSELIKLATELGVMESIVFLGQLDIKQKCNAYKFCDFVVVPSEIENFPAVPLEAMSLGKILIVNNAGGLGEIVKDKVNGIICDVKNTFEFQERVFELLNTPELKNKIEENTSEVKKYDWKNIVREYEKVFQKAKI